MTDAESRRRGPARAARRDENSTAIGEPNHRLQMSAELRHLLAFATLPVGEAALFVQYTFVWSSAIPVGEF